MAHIAFFNFPAVGHVNPTFGGVEELVKRGHRVTCTATEFFAPAVKAVGATPIAYESPFGEFYRSVEWMGLQRHLKVAGIFARLTLRDGKPRYLADAPRFIAYIRATANRYRQLGPLLKMLDQIEGTEPVTGFAYGRM